MLLHQSFILLIGLSVAVLSAPLDTPSNDENPPTHIQKIKRNNDGEQELSRPSPINPDIPSVPKPEEHIVEIPNQLTTTTEDSSENHPPSIHAYEKSSSNMEDNNKNNDTHNKPVEVLHSLLPITLGAPIIPIINTDNSNTKQHDISKRSVAKDTTICDHSSSATSMGFNEQNTPVPTTLGELTIAQPPPGYKHEKRSVVIDNEASSMAAKFETSHHIPAHVQLEQKHEDIDNPAEVNYTNVKKDILLDDTTSIKNPTIAKPILAKRSNSNGETLDSILPKKNAPVEPNKELLLPEHTEEMEEHRVSFIRPVPVDQIIKHSDAAPEIHASHHPTDDSNNNSDDNDSHDHHRLNEKNPLSARTKI